MNGWSALRMQVSLCRHNMYWNDERITEEFVLSFYKGGGGERSDLTKLGQEYGEVICIAWVLQWGS